MNYEDIRQFITSHIHEWDQSHTNVDVLYVNRKGLDDIDTSRPFVKLFIDYGTSRTASIDVKPNKRVTGTLTLQCFAPLDSGHRNLTLLVDELVSHCEYARSTDRKVQLLTATVVNVNNDRFFQINVNINFRASNC